jgi:predicted dehydrogenase
MQKPIRIGLMGPGSIADQKLIPALNSLPGAVFWSVLGRDSTRAQAFADKHKARASVSAHTDLVAFLSDPDLDAVIIASPDKLHAEQALACAAAGKHVFIEKPLATNLVDADRVVAAFAEAGLELAVGYHLRFHEGHKQLAAKIAKGDLGRILHIHVNWSYKSAPDDWRNKPETGRWWSLAAVGTHALDLAVWLAGPACGGVVSVEATCNTDLHGGPHDESAVVLVRFASGATATVVTNMNYTASRTVEITGSKGGVLCVDTLGPRGSGSILVNRQPLNFEVVDPYQSELFAFINHLNGDKSQTPLALASAGRLNVQLLEQTSGQGKA